jgi:acetyl-CoA C-acetyltransferase
MSTGFRDKVAIIGMGCSKFGERFDTDDDGLMVEAYTEALTDAGIGSDEVDAAWYSVLFDGLSLGPSGTGASEALRLANVATTRVENMCASGTEALRGAAYAVAAGASRIAVAIGAEKLKDTGFGGLPPGSMGSVNDLYWPRVSAPGSFAQLATAYAAKHRIGRDDLKRAMGTVSWKSHQNGARNPKAHLRKAVDLDTIVNAPIIAEPLGLFDCCGVSDGAACAVVTTPELARSLGKKHDLVTIKALQLANSNGFEATSPDWDGSYFVTTRKAAQRAYAEAGITDPRRELSLFEVHDCFSITELVTMEDLGISEEGRAARDILDGFYNRDGGIPCQIDGGLKCFGHPIGASGLRMAYEMYLQLQGRAGDRQLPNPSLALTHNLGGFPHRNVAAISILGRYDA